MNLEATSQEKDRIVKKLIGLKPIGVICPYCGSVEYISPNFSLEEYTGYEKFLVPCTNIRNGKTLIWFENESIHIKTISICDRCNLNVSKYEYYSNAIICTDAPIIKWDIRFSAPGVGVEKCSSSNCNIFHNCSLSKEDNSTWKYLTVGFLFDEEEYFGIVPKEETEMADTRTSTSSTTLPNLWTTSPKDWLEAIKKFGEAHKSTLQWIVAVGAVTIAAKLLKDNKNLSNEGKAMGLPFLEKKADIKRLATLGSAYAIVYGLSKTLFTSKNTEDFKEATAKAEELAEKNPSWEKRAEQVLPTAISIIIAYAMTEQPEWSSKIADSSNGIFIKAQTYMGIAKDVILDKLGIDDENAKKIAICIGVAGLLVFLYKGVKDKERLNEMANKFVEVSIKVAKELAPPAFAALATILINEKLWPDDVIDVTFSEIDDEEADAEAQLEEPAKPAKPAKRGRGKKVTETTATDTAADTADEDCTD